MKYYNFQATLPANKTTPVSVFLEGVLQDMERQRGLGVLDIIRGLSRTKSLQMKAYNEKVAFVLASWRFVLAGIMGNKVRRSELKDIVSGIWVQDLRLSRTVSALLSLL